MRVFRHYLSASALTLFLFESSVTMIVLFAIMQKFAVRELSGRADGVSGSVDAQIIAITVAGALAVSVIMYSVGLYERWHLRDLRWFLQRLAVCAAFCGPILLIDFTYTINSPFTAPAASALFYLMLVATVFACMAGARLTSIAAAKFVIAPHRVLVVGVGKLATEIEHLVSTQPDTDARIVGYLTLTDEIPKVSRGSVLACTDSLVDMVRAKGVKEIVVALDDRRGVPVQPLLEARMEGIDITSYLSFWERQTRRVNLTALEPSWLIYSDGFRVGTLSNRFLKQIFDFGVSLALLILTLPVLVLTMIAIRLEGPGPIFYRQERVGLKGKVFNIFKFRTMCVDAEGNGAPQWAALRDPRITRVGAFLRLSRIDELPQIWNVLRGEMSFVGPRPERPFFVESLNRDIPYYSERHRVRPGITGWAQINYPYGASIEDAKAKLSYDLYYIKNFSILFDFLILLATVQTVLWKQGGR